MAHFAAVLGTCEPEVFTEYLEQRFIWMAGALKRLTVDGQSKQIFWGCDSHSGPVVSFSGENDRSAGSMAGL
jgi:hypothetical protein